jgi:hypothetical protein
VGVRLSPITRFRDTPTYHYNGVVVTAVNGTPIGIDVTPPVVTASTNTTTLWPPNGKLVPVTGRKLEQLPARCREVPR